MSEGEGTAAAEGSTNGSDGQDKTVHSIPDDWAENDHYKEFFSEDSGFDFQRFTENYNQLKNSIPVVPETADDYSFEFPENSDIDEVDIKLTREMAKEAGLTQGQYEAVVKHDLSRMAKITEEFESEAKEAKNQLVKEWGGHDKFEANMAKAAQAAITFFGESFAERNDLGNDPELIKGLYQIATKISETPFKSGDGTGGDSRKIGIDGEKLFTYSTSAR